MGHTNKNKKNKQKTKNEKKQDLETTAMVGGSWELGWVITPPPRSLRIFVFLLFGFGAHVFDF